MKEIKILKIAKKKKNRYQIDTEENTFMASEDLVVRYRILKDKVFAAADLKKIIREAENEKYFNAILKYLSYSLRTENEVRIHLKQILRKNKAFLSPDEIDAFISRIKNLGYLNDDYLARYYLDYYIAAKKGPRYLQEKLLLKKVPDAIIRDVLSRYRPDLEREVISDILKHENLAQYPLEKEKNYLQEKLLRAGFNFGPIQTEINALKLTDHSADLIAKDYAKIKSRLEKKALAPDAFKAQLFKQLLLKGYDYQFLADYLKKET